MDVLWKNSSKILFCPKVVSYTRNLISLLKSESVTAVNYFSIIKTIADGNHKLGKIAGILGQETSSLTPYLSTLLAFGLYREANADNRKESGKISQRIVFHCR